MLPDDGIVDSRKETFTVRLTKLDAGEHIVSLRVSDQYGRECRHREGRTSHCPIGGS